MEYTLITGATSGIGLEFAKVAARDGKNVIIVGRDNTKLTEVKSDLNKHFPNVDIKTICKDLTEPDASKYIFEYTNTKNLQIDCLINNAGFGDYKPFAESDLNKQKDMIKVNIGILTELTHYYLPEMLKGGKGKILNLSSVAGFLPGPMMSVYYATKSYVLSFSQALAEELSGSGITVTALCPGPTDSNFAKAAGNERTDIFAKTRRLPTSRDVAEFGYRAMQNGRRVAIHGINNNLTTFAIRLVPTWLTIKLVHHYQRFVHKDQAN